MKAWAKLLIPVLVAVAGVWIHHWPGASLASQSKAHSIDGTLKDETGRPLAGAWVTALNLTTASLPRKTVVTDEDGRYSIADPPGPGPYQIRVRLYGYADRTIKNVSSGTVVNIQYDAQDRLGPKEMAAQYPAQYWVSLVDAPSESNVKAAGFQDQRHWMGQFNLTCMLCHQLGNALTRRPKTRAEWDGVLKLAGNMDSFANLLNRDLLLDTLAAWSEKIRGGALPDAPPRPAGKAAHYTLSEWDVGTPFSYQHDLAVSYVWDPAIGAAPPRGATGKWAYTGDIGWGTVYGVNVETNDVKVWEIPYAPAQRWAFQSWSVYPWKSNPHTLEVDKEGRLVILADISDEDGAGAFPVGNRDIVIFDPRTEGWTPIVTKCDTHTVRIDPKGRYWLSGNVDLLCMYDPKTKTERHWNLPVAFKSLGGFLYGIDVAPDGTVWFSQPFGNYFGRYDPATEILKQWEVPAPGYGPRRLRTDSKGNVWLPLVSGHVGVFEPKTERFRFWATPGPKRQSPASGTDYHYNLFVDRTGNAGKRDMVYISGTDSDSIIAFDPETEALVTYRVPTSGFFIRELEAFDRAIWTVYSNDPAKHVEKDPDQEVPIPRLVRMDLLRK
jgi:virginiamycin B lyase